MHHMKIFKFTSLFFNSVLLYFTFFFIKLPTWIFDVFGKVSLDQILFFTTNKTEGTFPIIIESFIFDVLLYCLFTTIFITFSIVLCLIISKNLKTFNRKKTILILVFLFVFFLAFVINYKINIITVLPIIKISIISVLFTMLVSILFFKDKYIYKKVLIYSFVSLILAFCNFCFIYDGFEYIYREIFPKYSNFYEQYYINPKTVNITIPKDKQNLLLICLESMDWSIIDYVSQYYNLDFSNISMSNLSFANYISGTCQYPTKQALVSMTTGIPFNDSTNLLEKFLKRKKENIDLDNNYSIYQILKDAGYSLFFLQGSSTIFANTETFLKAHGFQDSQICGLEKIRTDYKQIAEQWYGFDDKDIYEILKNKIIFFEKEQVPFFITMFTIQSHAGPNNKIKENSFLIKMSSDLLVDFLNWFKKQNCYKNTTIVIVGDHHRMGDNFDLKTEYDKKIYNVFINPLITPYNTNRYFNQVDLFPTILESIGFKIQGSKLGIGTSVFSKEQTLLEKLGKEQLEQFIKQRNKLYEGFFKYNS